MILEHFSHKLNPSGFFFFCIIGIHATPFEYPCPSLTKLSLKMELFSSAPPASLKDAPKGIQRLRFLRKRWRGGSKDATKALDSGPCVEQHATRNWSPGKQFSNLQLSSLPKTIFIGEKVFTRITANDDACYRPVHYRNEPRDKKNIQLDGKKGFGLFRWKCKLINLTTLGRVERKKLEL